jgi:maspardin
MLEKSLKIKGIEWHYTTGGRGRETILLFHGAVGGAETLERLAECFADEYRTIAPTVADVQTLDEVCDAASAILDREHVGRAIVFGGSFGGLIAQAFLKRRPRQVEHLILLSTGVPNRKIGARTHTMLKFVRLLPFRLTRALLKLEISKKLEAPAPADVAARLEEFRQRLDAYFNLKLTKETLLSRVRLSVDFNANETIGPADNPDWPGRILIIESNDDPMIPADERKRLRDAYPRALVCTFAGAGHLIPLLMLDELVGVVKAFLREDYKTPAELEQCLAAEAHEHTDECGILHAE